MFHFMLPTVTLLLNMHLIVFCVFVFLIYEMAGMRNEFGKRNGAFAEGRAS